jgi:hypothetical protein
MRRRGPFVLVVLALAPSVWPGRSPTAAEAEAEALATALRQLYAQPSPGERWRYRAPMVRLADGRIVSRQEAHRDRPAFVPACLRLLRSPEGDDALLGAWLLGSTPPPCARAAESLLLSMLDAHRDRRTRLEAALALARVGGPASLSPLETLARGTKTPENAAAAWAMDRIAERLDRPLAGPPASKAALAPGFCRGVNWWIQERRGDAGASSFGKLKTLGVDWVSIHTWDPLQRDVRAPDWAEPRRPLEIPQLESLVRNAHAAGMQVMVKPHLEMARAEGRPQAWHNEIEMRSEADWRAWFRRYEAYILSYAGQARRAGADAFCVGRETDRAAVAREADWRRLIARVRDVFKGPLTYSANFDSYDRIRFWDALDVIGVSAYFPLGQSGGEAHLRESWDRLFERLESFARQTHRRVVFTEIGYPALATAAERPWDDSPGPADVWLQARLYEAALEAVSRRPFMAGTFFWLWEGVAQPPFRDASFSIQDKPAAYVMARFYRGTRGASGQADHNGHAPGSSQAARTP